MFIKHNSFLKHSINLTSISCSLPSQRLHFLSCHFFPSHYQFVKIRAQISYTCYNWLTSASLFISLSLPSLFFSLAFYLLKKPSNLSCKISTYCILPFPRPVVSCSNRHVDYSLFQIQVLFWPEKLIGLLCTSYCIRI